MVESALGDEDWVSNASSENDQDELMDDAEIGEGDDDDEDIGDDDDGEGEGEGEGADDEDLMDQPPSLTPTIREDNPAASSEDKTGVTVNNVDSRENSIATRTQSPSTQQATLSFQSTRLKFDPRPEALTALLYDIVPTIAAPQSTSINAIAATPDMRYWFSGGSDCYIRKYDGIASINGKSLLTVAQRHPFVDSVTKAGVLMNYWDNEEPIAKLSGEDPPLSPVYSLAAQSEALWVLSGLDSGAINLYSVRHDEGKRIAYLQQHKSAVSALTISQDEKSVLSGSWDKNVLDWDLNTGRAKRSFEGSGGQISAIEIRPISSVTEPIPEEAEEPNRLSETYSSNIDLKVLADDFPKCPSSTALGGYTNEDILDSRTDSLFGGSDTNSLFGETTGDAAISTDTSKNDEEMVSMAIDPETEKHELLNVQDKERIEEENPMTDVKPLVEEPNTQQNFRTDQSSNGFAEAYELEQQPQTKATGLLDRKPLAESTFLAASIDGTLRLWDKRQQNPVAFIPNRIGVPPWCMAACWSPDGNLIYAGRRNGTVEEFSIHKGLKTAERTFKFPLGSGAVSALRAMPNGRHLICASHDILRLYDLKEPQAFKHSTVPFLIVPGPPRAGVISALHIDPTCRYMISSAGNRGWEGSTTEVLIGYEIGIPS